MDIQHRPTKDLLVDVGYFGSKGTHLTGIADINEAPPGAAIATGLVPAGTVFTTTNAPLLNAVRPYLGWGSIDSIETWFNSNYSSLQVNIQKRFTNNSLFNLSYVWSRNLTDNASDRSDAPQNTYNRHEGEYGLASYNRDQVLIFSYVYNLPFMQKQQGLAGRVLGGWEVSGITTFEDGLPSTAGSSLGTDPAGLGIVGLSSSAVPRPDMVCNPNAAAPHILAAWFNTSCLTAVPTGQVRPGNAGKYNIAGPGYNGWDFSLFKNVKITERASV